MTNISRVRINWSGFVGAPGVSTFYCLDPLAFVPQLRIWLTAIADRIPTVVDLNIEPGGDVINDVNGDLVDAWTISAQTTQSGTAAGVYAAPAGACVNWLTQTIADGRRIRGRTFLVPLTGAFYENDGSLILVARDDLQAASATLVTSTAGNMMVWHRPFPGAPATPTKAARPPHDGSSAVVTDAVVPDKVVVLTSRRD